MKGYEYPLMSLLFMLTMMIGMGIFDSDATLFFSGFIGLLCIAFMHIYYTNTYKNK